MAKDQAKYIDAFVLVVPKKNVAAYKKMAKEAAAFWKKHGALSYKECMGHDLSPETGKAKMLSFKKLTNLKPSETVWFSYIEYKNKRHRDQVNTKVMKEMGGEDACGDPNNMPFEMKRMSWGGFTVEVNP